MNDTATQTIVEPVDIDWDVVPDEYESTLLDDMCELGDLNGGLPTYVVMTAINRYAARVPGHGLVLDGILAEITAVARELMERGTRNA